MLLRLHKTERVEHFMNLITGNKPHIMHANIKIKKNIYIYNYEILVRYNKVLVHYINWFDLHKWWI